MAIHTTIGIGLVNKSQSLLRLNAQRSLIDKTLSTMYLRSFTGSTSVLRSSSMGVGFYECSKLVRISRLD